MRTGFAVAIALFASGMLPGCASRGPTASTQGTTLVQSGQVTDVRDVEVRGRKNSGLGSFAGAVLGGIAGSTIGSGHGSTVAGIGGAVAGSMAGQHLEQSGTSTRALELRVLLENGDVRTYRVPAEENFRVGDAVTVTTRGAMSQVVRRTDQPQ